MKRNLTKSELDRYMSSLEKRADAFKRKVLYEASSSFMEIVKEKAKQKDQSYSDDIEQRSIDDSGDMVIMVDTKEVEIHKVDDSVFYYRPKKNSQKYSEILNILREYEPYPKDLLPWRHDPREVKLVFRRVSKTEFEDIFSMLNIYNFLEKILPEIKDKLTRIVVPPSQTLSRGEVDASALVQEDLGFSVLRKELGIRTETVAVWKPSVEEWKKSGVDKKSMKKSLDVFDYDNNSYENIQNVASVDKDTVKDIDEFQKKLLG